MSKRSKSKPFPDLKYRINNQVYSLSRFTINPVLLKKDKISLSSQDPLFVIMKIFEKLTKKTYKSGIDFLVELYNTIKQSMLLENSPVFQSEIDYTESNPFY